MTNTVNTKYCFKPTEALKRRAAVALEQIEIPVPRRGRQERDPLDQPGLCLTSRRHLCDRPARRPDDPEARSRRVLEREQGLPLEHDEHAELRPLARSD